MKHQRHCVEWQELLAVSHPEDDLSPAEFTALQEHLLECADCAALRESYMQMTMHIRAVAASARPLPSNVPQLREKVLTCIEPAAVSRLVTSKPLLQHDSSVGSFQKRVQVSAAFVAVLAIVLLLSGLFHKPPIIFAVLSRAMYVISHASLHVSIWTSISFIAMIVILALGGGMYATAKRTHKESNRSHIKYKLLLLAFVLSFIASFLPFLALVEGQNGLFGAVRPGSENGSQLPITSPYVDIVIVMDNLAEIKAHDPSGVRFSAAQLFVDMAPRGDKIGVVRIPSKSQPSPVELLKPETIRTHNDRDLIKRQISQSLSPFRSVDSDPTGYFVPALLTAGAMLNNLQDSNHKYIVLVTDSVAFSGDQNACPQSPDQYHRWFCTTGQLESEGISVILIGFTAPGSQNQEAGNPTASYVTQHGGAVLQVDGSTGIVGVADLYAQLLSRIHPNIFQAVLNGETNSVNVDTVDHLTGLTFVALGDTNTSLTWVSLSGNVAGQSNSDGTLYNSSGVGYWLQNISSDNLAGTWHLGMGASPPSEILVLGVSDVRFQLLDPTPSDGSSELSVRLVPPNQRVVLRARATGIDGNSIKGISFVANLNDNNQQSIMSTVAGSDGTDVGVVLGVPSATAPISTLHIGLGTPLAGRIYLEKQFEIGLS